ncbi:class I lanthipeptide, partial [Aquimarina sp. U1-2]|uniref:class I lanthipeptide n=1 Tax=Aquimarina sp. U1-2 TaxID=2823141 RepID=UPI001AEC80D0|nr:class I lanthipeptide [Aquimarina sp. U1-2]
MCRCNHRDYCQYSYRQFNGLINSLLNINIMKSQNVNNKLRFDKNALVELNDEQLT